MQKYLKQKNQNELKWVTETSEAESTGEIGIVFLQNNPDSFDTIKKMLEDLKESYNN